jgi:starch phosphorylase
VLEVAPITPERVGVNEPIEFAAKVFLGDLRPDDVKVELYIGTLSPAGDIIDARTLEMSVNGSPNAGVSNYRCATSFTISGRMGYSVRVLPGHRSQIHPFELGLISWADEDL